MAVRADDCESERVLRWSLGALRKLFTSWGVSALGLSIATLSGLEAQVAATAVKAIPTQTTTAASNGQCTPPFVASIGTLPELRGPGQIHALLGAGQGSCPVPTHYYVQYYNFIPADHIEGPFGCYIGSMGFLGKRLGNLIYLGDGSPLADGYRIKQLANVASGPPGTSEPTNMVFAGDTINFQTPSSPVHGNSANLVTDDFRDSRNPNPAGRGPLHLCNRENAEGHADTSLTGLTILPNNATVSVTFAGQAYDPLEKEAGFAPGGFGSIVWHFTVLIDQTQNTATVTGTHDCFPSHRVMIGSQVIYDFRPSVVSLGQLESCLENPMTSHTISCPSVPLDGVSTCKNVQ